MATITRLVSSLLIALCIFNATCFGIAADNNVFNIKSLGAHSWIGEVGQKHKFAVFTSKEYACRAFVRNARTQYHRGVVTPTAFLSLYAPASENDTARYIWFICQHLHVGPNDDMLLFDRGRVNIPRMVVLAQAIAKFETGIALDESVILKGIELER